MVTISAYHYWSCEFEPRSWLSVLDTTLCDKVCQWLVTGRWFSTVSLTNKIDRHDIPVILLKVALNTITLPLTPLSSKYVWRTYFGGLKMNLLFRYWKVIIILETVLQLSTQDHKLYAKQTYNKMPHCWNSSKNVIGIFNRQTSIPVTPIYMTAHIPGLVQTPQ